MNKRFKSLLVAPLLVTPLLAISTTTLAQTDQTYATYITEEQWSMVNELPGVDRQIVSRDIGKLNLSVGIIHRGAVERASGRANQNPQRPCGVTSSSGVWYCTVSPGATGWIMARFISPRKRLGKMRAWGGPSQRIRFAASTP